MKWKVRRKWFSTWHTSHCLASSKDQLEILFVKYVMRPGSSWPALQTQLVCCYNQPCKNVVPNLGFSLLCSALPFTKRIRVVEIQRIYIRFSWSRDHILSVDYISIIAKKSLFSRSLIFHHSLFLLLLEINAD